jgi:hypothetical protein
MVPVFAWLVAGNPSMNAVEKMFILIVNFLVRIRTPEDFNGKAELPDR